MHQIKYKIINFLDKNFRNITRLIGAFIILSTLRHHFDLTFIEIFCISIGLGLVA